MDGLKVRASLLNLRAAEDAFMGGKTIGEADLALAAYDIPDTNTPHGVKERQVLDFGCFGGFCKSRSFVDQPVPVYVDHGNAILQHGYASSALKIGKAIGFEEREQALKGRSGLVANGLYNLVKQAGRESFSDLIFNPDGEQFSFRWKNEEAYRGADGFEHIREIDLITEVSQVGALGAQEETGVLVDSIHVRAAIRPHSTGVETEGTEWDEQAMYRSLSNDAGEGLFERAFAFRDPDGDPEQKASYRFGHHLIEDGRVGSASAAGILAAIEDLNTRSGELTEFERRSVYRHLVGHLQDGKVATIPVLKTRMPSAEQLVDWLADPALRTAAAAALKVETTQIDMPHEELVSKLRSSPDLRAVVAKALDEASKDPFSVGEWYAHKWRDRLPAS